MDSNVEFLNYIYQNAKMGIVGIDNVEGKIENPKLLLVIMEQRNDYLEIVNESLKLFDEYGKQEKDINLMTKISTYVMSNMMLVNGSDSKIAKMMIEGSNMGIIAITEKLNSYDDINKDIIKLGKKLLLLEEHNLENLKKYL